MACQTSESEVAEEDAETVASIFGKDSGLDIEELATYIEQHPDDHAQRWRLAKRLYMAWEYQRAQEHLRYLKAHWGAKLNVYRYLAASYYRLGRYDLALVELSEAVERWPAEAPLWQQLARVLEMAGRRDEAVDAWREILRLKPSHPMAKQAIERLSAPPGEGNSQDDLGLAESDSGIDLSAGVACSRCGAHNDNESERCWQCDALLIKSSVGMTGGTPEPMVRTAVSSKAPIIIRGVLTLLFVLLGAVLVIQGSYAAFSDAAFPLGASSVDDALQSILLLSRTTSGILLIVCWPLVLSIALGMFAIPQGSPLNVISVGSLLGASAHVMLWSPAALLPFALIVPAIGSIALMVWAFPARFGQIVGAWFVQGVLSLSIVIGCFMAFEGFGPIVDLPDIIRASADDRDAPLVLTGYTPFVETVQMQASGSSWLDRRASRAVIEVDALEAVLPLTVEVRHGEGVIHRELVESIPYVFPLDVAPRNYYMLIITGPERAGVSVSIYSVLSPRLS